jgi:hypothetical protein
VMQDTMRSEMLEPPQFVDTGHASRSRFRFEAPSRRSNEHGSARSRPGESWRAAIAWCSSMPRGGRR